MRTRSHQEKPSPRTPQHRFALRDLIQGPTGAWGERIAARYLDRCGVVILKRNWSSTRLEADIIGVEHKTIVVIEVKTRHSSLEDTYPALDAIDAKKITRLRKLGERFIANNGPLCRRFGLRSLRIDALEVYYRTGPLGCRIKTAIYRHQDIGNPA